MQILAVVVLYKRTLEESQTIRGLARAFELSPELCNSIRVLIWDNSPAPLAGCKLPFSFEYRHTPQNLGVSGAYNGALEIADGLSCGWMLLLDQDTTLGGDYLRRMRAYAEQLNANQAIAAIAPFLLDGSQTISPTMVRFYGMRMLPQPFSGVHKREMYAANSGTLMRVAALKESGGYDENFWLDFSDIVAFRRLDRLGKRLYIAGDLQLPHDLACRDYDGSMSVERYRNFMNAENAYWDMYRPAWQNGIQTLRLLARAIKQYIRFRNKEFSRITWAYLGRRIVLPKSKRLSRWNRQPVQRDLPVVSAGQIIR